MDSARPIVFIETDEKGGYRVNQEALDILATIKKPVSVVSVVGKYRTGKSFLLNRILLDRQSGFGVGPTIRACTKGIWMWSEPLSVETADGEDCALLLLDTEGLGALDEDANHDTRIFLLGLLLASNFIYNSVGSLDESALNNLSLIVNLTKQLQVRSGGIQDADEMSQYFPSLLWVLRDFALQLIDKSGNEISPKEYLENALMPQKGVSDNIEQKNRIRRYIKHFFKERDCFPLIRPTEQEEALQALDTAEESVFRPEFLSQMSSLRKFVYRKAKLKMLNGKKVNGDMLGSLATAYVEAINTGSVPNIDSAWNYMCKSECDRLTQVCVSDLETAMTGFNYPEKSSVVKEKYQKIRDDLIQRFRSQAVGPQIGSYEIQLNNKLREVYMLVKETNEKAVAAACERAFAGFYRDSVEKLKTGEYTQLATFKRDLDAFIMEFRKGDLKGITAEKKLAEFSEKILTEASEHIQRNVNLDSQNQQRRMAQMLEIAQTQLAQKKDEFTKELDDLKSKLEKAEKDGHANKAQALTASLQLEEYQRDKQRIEDRYKERIEELKSDHMERNAELKQRVEEYSRQLAELQAKHARELAALEKDKALIEQELKFRREECESLKTTRIQLENEAKTMREEILALKENKSDPNLVKQMKEEVARLKGELEKTEVGESWKEEMERLKAELKTVREKLREAERQLAGQKQEGGRGRGGERRPEGVLTEKPDSPYLEESTGLESLAEQPVGYREEGRRRELANQPHTQKYVEKHTREMMLETPSESGLEEGYHISQPSQRAKQSPYAQESQELYEDRAVNPPVSGRGYEDFEGRRVEQPTSKSQKFADKPTRVQPAAYPDPAFEEGYSTTQLRQKHVYAERSRELYEEQDVDQAGPEGGDMQVEGRSGEQVLEKRYGGLPATHQETVRGEGQKLPQRSQRPLRAAPRKAQEVPGGDQPDDEIRYETSEGRSTEQVTSKTTQRMREKQPREMGSGAPSETGYEDIPQRSQRPQESAYEEELYEDQVPADRREGRRGDQVPPQLAQRQSGKQPREMTPSDTGYEDIPQRSQRPPQAADTLESSEDQTTFAERRLGDLEGRRGDSATQQRAQRYTEKQPRASPTVTEEYPLSQRSQRPQQAADTLEVYEDQSMNPPFAERKYKDSEGRRVDPTQRYPGKPVRESPADEEYPLPQRSQRPQQTADTLQVYEDQDANQPAVDRRLEGRRVEPTQRYPGKPVRESPAVDEEYAVPQRNQRPQQTADTLESYEDQDANQPAVDRRLEGRRVEPTQRYPGKQVRASPAGDEDYTIPQRSQRAVYDEEPQESYEERTGNQPIERRYVEGKRSEAVEQQFAPRYEDKQPRAMRPAAPPGTGYDAGYTISQSSPRQKPRAYAEEPQEFYEDQDVEQPLVEKRYQDSEGRREEYFQRYTGKRVREEPGVEEGYVTSQRSQRPQQVYAGELDEDQVLPPSPSSKAALRVRAVPQSSDFQPSEVGETRYMSEAVQRKRPINPRKEDPYYEQQEELDSSGEQPPEYTNKRRPESQLSGKLPDRKGNSQPVSRADRPNPQRVSPDVVSRRLGEYQATAQRPAHKPPTSGRISAEDSGYVQQETGLLPPRERRYEGSQGSWISESEPILGADQPFVSVNYRAGEEGSTSTDPKRPAYPATRPPLTHSERPSSRASESSIEIRDDRYAVVEPGYDSRKPPLNKRPVMGYSDHHSVKSDTRTYGSIEENYAETTGDFMRSEEMRRRGPPSRDSQEREIRSASVMMDVEAVRQFEEKIKALKAELNRTKKLLKESNDQKNAALRRIETGGAQKAGPVLASMSSNKELLAKTVGLLCRYCSQIVVVQFFLTHSEECQRDYEERLRVNPDLTLISVPQATLDGKGGEKFVVSCKRGERVWMVTRTFEAARKLQVTLDETHPAFEYPSFAEVLRASSDSIYSKARSMPLSEKQKELERYLTSLANGALGKEAELRRFLG